jgi:hypothetical protein
MRKFKNIYYISDIHDLNMLFDFDYFVDLTIMNHRIKISNKIDFSLIFNVISIDLISKPTPLFDMRYLGFVVFLNMIKFPIYYIFAGQIGVGNLLVSFLMISIFLFIYFLTCNLKIGSWICIVGRKPDDDVITIYIRRGGILGFIYRTTQLYDHLSSYLNEQRDHKVYN